MIDKKFVLFVVKRYLRFDKEQPFIFLSALLAFLGISVGVAVLIVAMAIMNGFDKEFERKLFVMNYPLTIYPKLRDSVDENLLNRLSKRFEDLKFSPYISAQAIVKNGDLMEGAMLFGVDFEKELQINSVLAQAVGQSAEIPQKYGAIVGKEMYDRLYLQKGEKATFIFTKLDPAGLGMSPLIKRFTIEGFFRSGLQAYDRTYVYVPIDSLRKVLNIPQGVFGGIHVYSDSPKEAIEDIRDFLPPEVGVVGWWQQNGNFFAALQMEKRALFIVLMLIILIASLNIVSSLLMTVMNRRKEIALLLALGASKKEIGTIFFYLGSIIGGFGIVTGALGGLLGIWVLGSFDIIELPADVYGTSRLPLELSLYDFASILVGAALISLISSYYPARKATETQVIEVLRNE